MNKEVAHKLGELIMALSRTVTYVKLSRERNMLNGDYVKMQCYIVHNNKVYELSQLLTDQDILNLTDAEAMADMIGDKIRSDSGLPKRKS